MQRKVTRAMPKSPTLLKPEENTASPLMSLAKSEKPGVGLTPLNFRVPETFHREFKIYAAQQGMSMVDLLQASFAQFRKRRGD